MTNRASLRFRFIEWGIALVILCFALSAQAQLLTLQNPLPAPTNLRDIHAVGSTIYAAGEYNTLLKSTDGGTTWAAQYGDQPAVTTFNSSFFLSAGEGWTVGGSTISGGCIEFTNNGGATWGRQIVQQATTLNSVYFYSSTLGWTVGAGLPPLASASVPFIFLTTDGGNTWTRQTTGVPNSANAYMESVTFGNNATGWAVGYDPNISSNFILNTTNSGTQWNDQTASFPAGEHANSILAMNLSKLFLAGDSAGFATVFESTNGGTTWNNTTFTGINGTVKKVVFPTANTGYAAGMEDSSGIVKPFLLKTTNGGLSWKKIYNSLVMPANGAQVNSISAADANNIYLCGGDNGSWIAVSNDGGNTWSVKSYNAASTSGGMNPTLLAASFVDNMNGWSVGYSQNFIVVNVSDFNTVVLNTTNGGNTWNPVKMPANLQDMILRGVSAVTMANVWACGEDGNLDGEQVILHTTNGGGAWAETQSPFTNVNDLKFSSDSNGIVVGNASEGPAAYYTTDGGNTWNPSTVYYEGYVSSITRIGSFYGKTAWAVGNSGNGYVMLNTVDGGQHWNVTQTRIFGESIQVTYIPSGISFTPSGQYGWVTGTEDSNGVFTPFIAYNNNYGNPGSWTEQSDSIFIPNWLNPNPPFVHTNNSQLDNVVDVLAFSQLAAVAVTTQSNTSPYAGNRVIATTDGGLHWYNIDSGYVGTRYTRIAGVFTNRIDGWAIGGEAQIRHGYVNVPRFSTDRDSMFQKTILSWEPTDSITETLPICNPGTAPLTIEDWFFDSDDNAYQDYTVVYSPANNIIPPGTCDSIVIQFKPDQFDKRPAIFGLITNAVDTPVVIIQLNGAGGLSQVATHPASLFGNDIIPVNTAEIDTVWVCNPGTPGVYAQIHVTNAVLDNHDNCYSIVKSIDQRILPSDCDYFLVKFQPTSGGPKHGTLTFTTNTRAFPSITVQLGGVGGVRLIASDVNGQNYVDTVNCSDATTTKCFAISNPGTLPMHIDSVKVIGTYPSDYTVQGTFPATLAPGANDSICVVYAPTHEGADSAQLFLYSDAFNAPKDSLALNGVGLEAQLTFSSKQVIRILYPTDGEGFDTSIVIHNVGNTPAYVTPNVSTYNFWSLNPNGSFSQIFADSTILGVLNQGSKAPRKDTLFVYLTWGNANSNFALGCGSTHLDTIEFVLQFGDTTTSVKEQSALASSFALLQNYPNPFNPVTNIQYAIPQRENVTLTVYNMLGEVVQTLVQQAQDGGTYNASFDASNLPNGNYYYELRAGSFVKRMMMTVSK